MGVEMIFQLCIAKDIPGPAGIPSLGDTKVGVAEVPRPESSKGGLLKFESSCPLEGKQANGKRERIERPVFVGS